MSSEEIIKLEIPISPKYVGVARRALEAIGGSLSMTEQQMDDLVIAVGEACTNAVKFSQPAATTVQIEYRISPGCLQIWVSNQGAEFRPDGRLISRPDMAELRAGGLGLYIIEQCVDNVDFRSENGNTVIAMTKQF